MPDLNITINLEYDGDLDRDEYLPRLVSEIQSLDIDITSLTVEAEGDD